jgi:aldose 1-epimerase
VNETARSNHIHGFLHRSSFEVARAEVVADRTAELELRFRFDSSRPEYAYFPREFLAVQTYRLSLDGLSHELSVRNEGAESMPVGVAVHANFKVPFSASGGAGDCRAAVTIGRKWELNERVLPTGGFVEYAEPDRLLAGPGFDPVAGVPLVTCCYDAAPAGNRAEIADGRAGYRMVYEPDGAFKFWIAWNKDGRSGFVSFEPQSWMINAPNLAMPAAETGMRMLAPGEEWRGSARLRAEPLS